MVLFPPSCVVSWVLTERFKMEAGGSPGRVKDNKITEKGKGNHHYLIPRRLTPY